MEMKHLTIAGLKIYFDEKGTAQFTPKKKQRAAVEQVVRECRDFIEQWLKASEEPETRKIGPEEQQMRSSFESLVMVLGDHADREAIAELLRNVVKKGRRYPNMTHKQVEEGIANALSALDR
jgi:hypothetical protein